MEVFSGWAILPWTFFPSVDLFPWTFYPWTLFPKFSVTFAQLPVLWQQRSVRL